VLQLWLALWYRAGTLPAVFIGKRTLTRVASFEVIGQEISTSFASGINALWVAVLVFGLAYAASVYTAWVSRPRAAITLLRMATKPPRAAISLPRGAASSPAASPDNFWTP